MKTTLTKVLFAFVREDVGQELVEYALLGVFVAVVGWVMVDSYTRLPIYRATARVLIENADNDIATPSEISRPTSLVDPEIYMQTQLRIIRGRDLSQRVAKKLDLDKVAEFNGQGPKPTQLARGIALVKYYAMWPYRLITSSSSAPSVLPPMGDDENSGDLAQRLMARINVAQVRGSQLVDLYYDGPDPVFAARAVNTYADEYVSENLSLKVQTLEKSAEWLSGEVERQGRLVQQSELELAQYREKQDAGALDSSQNNVVARLNSLNDELTKARTARIQRESQWKQVQAAGTDIESISSVIANPAVQNLRTQLNALQQERSRVSERYGE